MSDTATETPVEERTACLCGCGEFPKHKQSRFMPGHDAQLKAQLYRTIRDTETPEPDREAARLKLDQFEWPQPAPKRARKPKAPKDGNGSEAGEVTAEDL